MSSTIKKEIPKANINTCHTGVGSAVVLILNDGPLGQLLRREAVYL